jgi:hypothetical protein
VTTRLQQESGAGLVSTLGGVLVFLFFVLFTAQILVHLFASSYVNAAAFDAARLASGSEAVTPGAARAHGLGVLGSFASRVAAFDVETGPSTVTVRVRAASPALLPGVLGRGLGLATIDRTVTVRRELAPCEGC